MNYLGDVVVASVTDRWLGGIKSIHNPFRVRHARERKIINAEKETSFLRKRQRHETGDKERAEDELYSILCPVRFNFPVEIGFLI